MRLAAVLMVAVLSASITWAGDVRGNDEVTPAAATSHSHHSHHGGPTTHDGIIAPTSPSDGVLTIVIPRGTDAMMKSSGDATYHMPSVIRVTVGDTMVIRNDDTVPHMILYTFLRPGETDTRVFDAVGSETYTSGCAANAADFHDFTTIFVTD